MRANAAFPAVYVLVLVVIARANIFELAEPVLLKECTAEHK
jgi:hypothetical protein